MKEYKKRKAFTLLDYYLKTIWEKSGLIWTQDNENEIEELINYLFEDD
jgi:hypothetical protein